MNTYTRHRFPRDIISYAVWLYYRFNLRHLDIEGLLAERGITNVGRRELARAKAAARHLHRFTDRQRGFSLRQIEVNPQFIQATDKLGDNCVGGKILPRSSSTAAPQALTGRNSPCRVARTSPMAR
ncbi:MAG: hypothetical protein ACJAYC_000364 [Halieaceae bacterium]|jgi:hypothetical protein